MPLVINVYGYNVHYIKKSDGTIMYFAADIVKQYNTKNGKKKQFKNCLANKDTIDLIQVIAENQEKMSGIPLAGISSEGYGFRQNVWHVENVIEYVKIEENNWAMAGYVVCLELLHHILMWCDVKFGYTVYHFLSQEFEKSNSPITEKLHKEYYKLLEKNNELTDEVNSLKAEKHEIINKVKRDTDTSYCDYEIDRYITYIYQKDNMTLEVKKLSKNYNKAAYKKFLYDYFCDKMTKEQIDAAILNNEEPEFDDTDLRIIYAKNNGVGESFKRYIINMLKEQLRNCSFIHKITLNKIIFNRSITVDDIIYIRKLCKQIRTDVFTYNPTK